MNDAPQSAQEFFTRYLPERFATAKSAMAGRSSQGSMVFRVAGTGEWSIRLSNGELLVTAGPPTDPLIQVDVSQEDFQQLVVQAARVAEQVAGLETQLLAFRALTVDAERAAIIRSVTGSVAFVISDGGSTRTITITSGAGAPHVDAPDCRLECTGADFLDMQAGRQLPIQLAMSGRLRILGNAQIAMALNSVFS